MGTAVIPVSTAGPLKIHAPWAAGRPTVRLREDLTVAVRTARHAANRGRPTAEAGGVPRMAAEAVAPTVAAARVAAVAEAVAEVVVHAAVAADIRVARTGKALPREATPFRPADSFSSGHLA